MVTEPYPHYRCTLPSHQDPGVVQTAAQKHFRPQFSLRVSGIDSWKNFDSTMYIVSVDDARGPVFRF